MRHLQHLIDTAIATTTLVEPSRARELFERGEALCLDVREHHELAAKGRIPRSLHAPRSNLEWYLDPASADHLPQLAAGHPIVLVCGSGKRAALSLATLRQFGQQASVLAGGMAAWQAAGFPLATGMEAQMMSTPSAPVRRLHAGPRMSQVSIAGGVAYLAGQVAADAAGRSTAEQARQIFAAVDAYLAEAGSSRSSILQVTIYLTDMADYAEFNAVWDAWIDPAHPPSRACIQSPLARPEWRVELVLTAAVPG